MKQIIAIVKPFLVEKILDALRRAPLEAVSVAEVKGMGKQKSYLDRYADTEYARTFLPKVEITRLGRRPAGRGCGPQDRRSRPHGPHGRRQDLHSAGRSRTKR